MSEREPKHKTIIVCSDISVFKNVIRIDLDDNICDRRIEERFIRVSSSFDIERLRGAKFEKAYIVKQYPVPYWINEFKEYCHYRNITIGYIQ